MLFKQVKTKERNPTEPGWYPTDKGNLYWFNGSKEWSCRSNRVSAEYPTIWYEPVKM